MFLLLLVFQNIVRKYHRLNCLKMLQTELLEMGTTALCSLLQAQPALLDLVPSMGHIPRLCRQMGASRQVAVPKSAIQILNALSLSTVSVFPFVLCSIYFYIIHRVPGWG